MLANLRPALVITRREIRDQFRDWRIVGPTLVLTLFFPALMNFVADRIITFMESYNTRLLGEQLVPFLLMVVGFFPISFTLVIALESFVGEAERRSIEPLLSSPLTDFQLYIGKLIAVVIPPLMASFLGITVYLVGVYRQLGWRPEPVLLFQVIALTIVQAVVMVSGAVVISSQTTSTRAANLLASFIIVPMSLILISETISMFWSDYSYLWLFLIGQLVIAMLLIRMGIAHFNRENLLGRELDTLNLRWFGRVFLRALTGGADSIRGWYRGVLTALLQGMRSPVLLSFLLLAFAFWLGWNFSNTLPLPADLLTLENAPGGFGTEIEGLGVLKFYSVRGLMTIFWHNLRTVLLTGLLGLVSFGSLGMVLIMLPFVVIGFLVGLAAHMGFDPGVFILATVVPHGVLEIPAIVLSGAMILKLGASFATPSPGQTISESLAQALGEAVRLFLALIVPLFLGAALLEIYVTPRVVSALLGI